jgi:hypothetical protein
VQTLFARPFDQAEHRLIHPLDRELCDFPAALNPAGVKTPVAHGREGA